MQHESLEHLTTVKVIGTAEIQDAPSNLGHLTTLFAAYATDK